MPDEPTVAEPQAPEAEPPAQPKPRNDVAELQRIKDREVAEANRSARDARKEADEAHSKLAQLEQLYAEAREKANFSDDDEAYAKRRLELEREVEARAKTTFQAEKNLTVKILSAEYGIPAEELEAYDNPKDMEIAALKYSRTNASAAPAADEENPNGEVPPEEEAPTRTDFDLGTGTGTSKSFKDMSKEEFAAWEKTQASQARQRAMRRA